MTHQLPPLTDDVQFEKLVRDVLRRVYDDPGIERFGRPGQSQSGIDGIFPGRSKTTFQCKLKDTRYEANVRLQKIIATEMETELAKTKGLESLPERFIFASTFKNDATLQELAKSLSSDCLTVEYWGWDTLSERVWEYAEVLIPVYYPEFPVRAVPGFKQITSNLIDRFKTDDAETLKALAIEYYRINDRSDLLFRVVCNNIDVRNDSVMQRIEKALEDIGPSGTLWIIGDGGSGKTTVLHRVAVELAQSGHNVCMLNLEAHLSRRDLESVLSVLRYGASEEPTVLCVDNPAADEEMLESLLREIPNQTSSIHVIFSERAHRHRALCRTDTLTYLHGEQEHQPVHVRNPVGLRQAVYDRLFELLGVSESDKQLVRHIILDERLVYVNATYSILLELKRHRKIEFDFDWDDYRKISAGIPSFREGYKYIALFYLFAVRTPFSVFSRMCGATEADQKLFLEKFAGLVNEPIIVDQRRDETSRRKVYLRTKHEIVSEIFFLKHREIDKDELLRQWAEHTDFSDPDEAQSLVNIFGDKKNYLADSILINFDGLIEFLLNSYIKERVSHSPKLLGALYLAKAWGLLLRNQAEDAISALKSLLEIQPRDLHSRNELARVYQSVGWLDEAEAVLVRVLEIDPDDIKSRTELSKIYQKRREFERAESVLLQLLQLDERNIRAKTELARVYQHQGKLVDAEAMLLSVLNSKPNDLNSRTELAKIYRRQGKLSEAEGMLHRVLELKPKDLDSRTELAKIYQRQGKLPEAENVLSKLLELDPTNLQARTELAKIYQRQGKLEEATKRLEEYIQLDPTGLHPRTELAKIYQRQGKLEEATKRLEEYIQLDPTGLHPRTELAKIYQRQGKLEEAEARLLESLEIDDKQLHPLTELAKIYQRQGKLKRAERVLLTLLELDPNNLQARTELARIYRRLHRLEEAAQRGEEALSIDPLNDHAISELLATWQTQGRADECTKRFMAFISQARYRFSRSSQAPVFRFFQCCRQFGKKEEARIVFQRFERELDDRNLDYYRKNFT